MVVKGIMTSEDTERAVKHGLSGVIVSNHGGRQLDQVGATIEALPECVAAANGKIPVLVDGGFRRGTDIFKALALGATAVGIGRPYLWGLSAFGQPGVVKVVEILRAELAADMGMAGTGKRLADRSLVRARSSVRANACVSGFFYLYGEGDVTGNLQGILFPRPAKKLWTRCAAWDQHSVTCSGMRRPDCNAFEAPRPPPRRRGSKSQIAEIDGLRTQTTSAPRQAAYSVGSGDPAYADTITSRERESIRGSSKPWPWRSQVTGLTLYQGISPGIGPLMPKKVLEQYWN